MNLKAILEKYGITEDVIGTCGIQDLRKNHVSFLTNSQYLEHLSSNSGAFILVESEILEQAKKIEGNIYIESENPLQAFLEIHNTFYKDVSSFSTGNNEPTYGIDCEIDSSAKFGTNVVLGDRVVIHPNVVIGSNVMIGDDTKIFAGSAIYDRVRLGMRNTINANASIGGDGFRIIRDETGRNHRLIHTGGIVFGNDVEFGSSSCIDRGSFGNTILENDVKVDNMVHIGHNAYVKENSQLAASSCIGGSTVIGKNCWIGIGATLSNGLTIGDYASVLINAVVTRDVPEHDRVAGFYALPNDAWILLVKDNAKRFGQQARKMQTKSSE